MDDNSALIHALYDLMPQMDRMFIKPFENNARSSVSNGQLKVLFLLARRGKMSMGEIAECLDMSKQQTTFLVDGLVDIGYAQRVSDPLDRRRIEINITQKSVDLLDHLKIEITETCNDYFSVLSGDEKKQLHQHLCECSRLVEKMLKEKNPKK